jgi:hypothetical protein
MASGLRFFALHRTDVRNLNLSQVAIKSQYFFIHFSKTFSHIMLCAAQKKYETAKKASE